MPITRLLEKTNLDGRGHLVGTASHLLQHLLEVLGPLSDWQLGDLDGGIINLVDDTADLVLVGLGPLDGSLPSATTIRREHTLKPRNQGVIFSTSSPFISRWRFSTISRGL